MKHKQGFHIYINQKAGTVSHMGQAALEALISSSDLPVAHLYFLKPEDLIDKICHEPPDAPILVGGGDGTIKACAECLMENQTPFGILPLGTMNLLAKDLDIPLPLDETLAAYAKGVETYPIDVGRVNDAIFLCCVGLGTIPEASKYREEHRSDSQPVLIPRLTAYVLRQIDRFNRRKLTLTLDSTKKKKIKSAALVVSNNQYGPQGQWNEENFRKLSLQDGKLGVYSAAPYSFWDKLRLLSRLFLGNWKKDEALQEWQCSTLGLACAEPSVLLSLDGETQTFDTPLTFSILPRRLQILIPKGVIP